MGFVMRNVLVISQKIRSSVYRRIQEVIEQKHQKISQNDKNVYICIQLYITKLG